MLALGTAASKGLVLVATLLLTRELGPEDFGRYTLVFAYLAFFELISDCGLDTLAVRELARDGYREEGRRVLGDSLVLRGLLILLVVPAAALLFPLVTGNRGDALLIVLAGLTLLAGNRRPSLRSLFEVPFRADLAMGLPTFLGVLAELLHLGLLLVLLDGWGLAGAVGAQGLAPLPLLLPMALVSMRRLRPRIRPSAGRLAELLRRASPLLGALLLNVVLVRIDVIMLDRMRGPAEVGLYAAPVRIVEVLNLLPILLMTSVYPLLSRHAADREMVDRLFRVSLRVLTTIVVPVVALEIAFAGPLVSLFFGDAYDASAGMLPWLALAEIMIFADIVIGARLVATGRETRNLQLVTFATLTNVAVNLALIPALGGRGAALATLGAYVVRVASGALFPDTRGTTALAFRSLGPATLAGVLCFGPAMLFDGFRLAAFTFGVVAYPVALYLLGAIRIPEVTRLLAAFREASSRGD